MRINEFGIWQANPEEAHPQDQARGSQVCPFSDQTPSETEIASELFPELPEDPFIGRHREVFAAQVSDSEVLESGSSGGLTTWILLRLLERRLVDGVIHVGEGAGERLFSYRVSYSANDLLERRKSIYYSTSMAEAFARIAGDGRKYAVVGVPCFITAGRLLAKQDPLLHHQLAYFVGLVCGHLKSPAFAELLAWQVGIPPHKLRGVDFRVKNPQTDAAHYDFEAMSLDGESRRAATSSLLGGDWGLGLFQLEACNYCDDVFAETADIVMGDAWLPELTSDWRGHNVVVTRHSTLAALIRDGEMSGELKILPMDITDARRSQAGNFRHRREGLALRLHDDTVRGLWTPIKRVRPSSSLPPQRKAIVRARRSLSAHSFSIFQAAKTTESLDLFIKEIAPHIDAYKRAYHVWLPRRLAGRVRRKARRLLMSLFQGQT